ncbi:hypothetical protein Taro_001195 [Colocasia esculenta]|uniref:Uncharacterized protein n=1 Tax=Colocasia esculenta TaxID=4460 RepID=A0A843TF67_COLES|nr:hypothetical protein [Colocasia esculenta]
MTYLNWRFGIYVLDPSHGKQSSEILARSRENIGLGPFPRNEKAEMSQVGLSGIRISSGRVVRILLFT